ncbi:MAG: hypothetical protein PHX05_07500 [Acidobacteriota bacterium]|nr:hypothetical protein [Acidobacteriota bacterium]
MAWPPAVPDPQRGFAPCDDLSPVLEKRFIEFVEERSGITFDLIKRRELKLDLLTRMEARGISSYRAYLEALLAGDPAGEEFKKLINLITINETYFMRVDEHFDLLKREVVPALLAAAPGRTLRILSAGCSSGEEVYSLIITLLEMQEHQRFDFSVIGSDINEDMLFIAEKGVYRGRTLAKVTDPQLQRYFDPYRDRFQVNAKVRAHARFHYVNVTEPLTASWLDDFDIVFFRNVLIYFSIDTTRRIIAGFHRLLRDGGYLFLGPSETLWDVSDEFELIMTPTAYIYRKGGGLPLPRGQRESAFCPPPSPAPARTPPPLPAAPEVDKIGILLEEAELMISLGEYSRAERLIGEILTMGERGQRPAALLRLTLLANQDRAADFLAYAQVLADGHPIFPELYFLLGRFHEAQRQLPQAMEQYRKVLFLNPALLLAREKVMKALAFQGEMPRARLEARNILAALASKNWKEMLPQVGEKVQPEHLAETCRRILGG